MKARLVRWLLAALFLLLAGMVSGGLTSIHATDPSVTLGLWFNFDLANSNIPSNYVTCAAVGSDGRLWIGTNGQGIAVYDGLFWTQYTKSSTGNGLASDYILSIGPDGSQVWVGTDNAGVSKLNTTSGQWTTFNTGNSSLPHNRVNAILIETPTGGYPSQFFATNAGLAQHYWDGTQHQWTVINTSSPPGTTLLSNYVYDLAGSVNGTFWIVTAGGVNKVVSGVWSSYTNASTPGCGVIESATTAAVDASGRAFFGTDRSKGPDPLAGLGLCATSDGGSTWQRFYRGGGGLTTNTIADLAVDAQGHLWVATNNIRELGSPGGVYRYTPSKGIWRHWGTSDGLSGDDAMVVAAGSDVLWFMVVAAGSDVLWFGVSGYGLDGFAPNWQAVGGEPSGIEALASTSGLLWVGSTSTGVWKYNGTAWTQYDTGDGLASNNMSALITTPGGKLWAGTTPGGKLWAGTSDAGVSYYDGSTWTSYNTEKSGLVDDQVRTLALDAKGRLWVGTYGGLSVYTPKDKAWSTIPSGEKTYPNTSVAALATDEKYVWVGTASGIGIYDGKKWYLHNMGTGLPSNDVQALAVDKKGVAWAGTTQGLASWNGSSWTTYTKGNSGLPDNSIWTLHVDGSGRLWVGTPSGAAVRDPAGTWTTYRARNSGLRSEFVAAITSDSDDGIWFGAFAGTQRLFVRGTPNEPTYPTPQITSFSPTSGTYNTAVTISGANFKYLKAVRFSAFGWGPYAWEDASYDVVDEQTIKAYVPSKAIKGPLQVETAGGIVNSSADFSPLPSITSFKPASGPVGAPVDIYGHNFTSSTPTEVRFGTSSWQTLFITETHSHIKLGVPGDATTGPIRVRTETGTATSSSNFTVSNATPVYLGWQVNQGLSQYPKLIAGKTSVVRVFVGSSTGAGPAYLSSARLRIYPWGAPAPHMFFASAPNQGWFKNTKKNLAQSGSIDFWVDGKYVSSPGNYHFQVDLYAGNAWASTYTLGDKQFWKTDDLTIYAVLPLPVPVITHSLTSLVTQLQNISRAYPVRDGWSALGGNGGVQSELRLTPICNGVSSLWYCKKDSDPGPQTGFQWDLIQDKYTGQGVARSHRTGFNGAEKDVTDTGAQISWSISSLKPNQWGMYRWVTQRIATTSPAGATIVSKVTFDSADQSGSPDATDVFTITLGNLASCPFHPLNTAAGQSPVSPLEGPGTESALMAPNLGVSARCQLVVDADSSGTPTAGDVVVLRADMTNTGAHTAKNCTMTIDYDETRLSTLPKGGVLVYNASGQIITDTVPGVWLDFGGWEGNTYEVPMDENYNGVIDASELGHYIAEFFDLNPATGQETRSTNLANYDAGEVIRSFVDQAPYNDHWDKGETRSPFMQRGMEGGRLIKRAIPNRLKSKFNQGSGPDAVHSGLWIWPTMNPFHGPGQGWGTSMWVEIAPSRPSGAIQQPSDAVLHEFGHSNYQVNSSSPHASPAKHTTNVKVPGEALGYDILSRKVFPGNNLPTIMWFSTQGTPYNTFFEGYEYGDIAKRQKARLTATAQESIQEGEVLVVNGSVRANGQAFIADVYPATDMQPTEAEGETEYGLLLWGEGEEPLLWWPVEVPPLMEIEAQQQSEATSLSVIYPENVVFFSTVCPLPPETVRLEFRRGDETLAALDRSENPPEVHLLEPNGGEEFEPEGELHVAWDAGDPDGDDLTFSVLYSPNGGETWEVLATGMSGHELNHPLETLAGSENALVEVQASDGFHEASDRSNGPFFVSPKPPLGAVILAPEPDDNLTLLQGRPVLLRGAAYDLEDGLLEGEHLQWHSDRDGYLGIGTALTVTLSVGEHTLILEAFDRQGRNAVAEKVVEVWPDFDGDGISDLGEGMLELLSPWDPNDADLDFDEDGLTNRDELKFGTDMDNPDSDGDGIPDAQEVNEGSDPANAESVPKPSALIVAPDRLTFEVLLGEEPPPSQGLTVWHTQPVHPLEWSASTEAPWLVIEPTEGETPGTTEVYVVTEGLRPGFHDTVIWVVGGPEPREVWVRVVVSAPGVPPIELPLILRGT